MPAPSRSSKGFVGILSVDLFFPEAGSLKEKRMFLRRIRDQVTRRHEASFAEVAYQDVWQRSRVVVAVVASDIHALERRLDRLRVYLDNQEWLVTAMATEVVEIDA